MVHLDLWNCLFKKEGFELGFEIREGGEIPTDRQWIPDSLSNENERTVAKRFEIVFTEFQKFLTRESEGAWSVMCVQRSWNIKVECTIEVTVGKRCNLVFTTEFHKQPMEFIQQWCNIWSRFRFFRSSQAVLPWTLCSQPISRHREINPSQQS